MRQRSRGKRRRCRTLRCLQCNDNLVKLIISHITILSEERDHSVSQYSKAYILGRSGGVQKVKSATIISSQ